MGQLAGKATASAVRRGSGEGLLQQLMALQGSGSAASETPPQSPEEQAALDEALQTTQSPTERALDRALSASEQAVGVPGEGAGGVPFGPGQFEEAALPFGPGQFEEAAAEPQVPVGTPEFKPTPREPWGIGPLKTAQSTLAIINPVGYVNTRDRRRLAREHPNISFAAESIEFGADVALGVATMGMTGAMGFMGFGVSKNTSASKIAARIWTAAQGKSSTFMPAAKRAMRPIAGGTDDVMPDIADVDSTVAVLTNPDIRRRVANLPIIRNFAKYIVPSAVANTLDGQYAAGRAQLFAEARSKAELVLTRLERHGMQDEVWGKLDEAGQIASGPLKGKAINHVIEHMGRYTKHLTPKMRAWIDEKNVIEEGRLAFLRRNGIKIEELTFEEGGHYGGRRLLGKIGSDGELKELGHVGASAKPGTKLASEHRRYFKDIDDAIKNGFRYLSDEQALFLNVQGAYNKVADERLAKWFLGKLGPEAWRASKVPEGVMVRFQSAKAQEERAVKTIAAIQRALRGENIPAQTIKSIRRVFEDVADDLTDVTKTSIRDVLKAAEELQKPPVVLKVPHAGTLKKLARLLREAESELNAAPWQQEYAALNKVKNLRKQLGFARYRASLGKPFEIERIPYKEVVKSRAAALQELLTKVRGTQVSRVSKKTGQLVKRYEGGLLEKVRLEKYQAQLIKSDAAARAARVTTMERRVSSAQLPALAGKTFQGEEVIKIVDDLVERLSPSKSSLLEGMKKINTVASIIRFMKLGADFSLIGIQMLPSIGRPLLFSRAVMAGMRAMVDMKYINNLVNRPENFALIAKHRNLILPIRTSEMAEAMSRGGILTRLPARLGDHIFAPFSRFYNGGQTVAGIEWAKTLDKMATSPLQTAKVDDFINAVRGLADTNRLGVSPFMQNLERMTTLAPQYNRAFATYITMLFHGDIRGRLAWESLSRMSVAMVATAWTIDLAGGFVNGKGADIETMRKRVTPGDPTFFTWNVGGQTIGPGSKLRSVLQLLGRSYKEPDRLLEFTMENPALAWTRGNIFNSPFVGMAIDLLTGRDYIGDPMRDNMIQLTGYMASQLVPLYMESMFLEGLGNAEVQSFLEDPKGAFIRGGSEAGGGRAYPQTPFFRFLEAAESHYDGRQYDTLTGAERDEFKKGNPQGKALWEAYEKDLVRRGKSERAFLAMDKKLEERMAALEEASSRVRNNEATYESLRRVVQKEGQKFANAVSGLEADPEFKKTLDKWRDDPKDLDEDETYRQFLIGMNNPEFDLGIDGWDYRAQDTWLEGFKSQIGRLQWMSVERRQKAKRLDLPPEVREWYDERDSLRSYFEAVNKFIPDDFWPEWEAYKKLDAGLRDDVKRRNEQISKYSQIESRERRKLRENPVLDALLVKWYGHTPVTAQGVASEQARFKRAGIGRGTGARAKRRTAGTDVGETDYLSIISEGMADLTNR